MTRNDIRDTLLDRLQPRRVLLFRALPPVDLLCAAPALRALRRKLPEAQIFLLGLPCAREFFRRYAHCLNGFYEFPGFHSLSERTPQAQRFAIFLDEMRADPFDLAIQMHGGGTLTNFILPMLQARHIAGFCLPGEFCPDSELFLPYPEEEEEPRRLLRLMEFLGAPENGDSIDFTLREEDFHDLKKILFPHRLQPDQFACLHAGTSITAGSGLASLFGSIAAALDKRGFEIVLTGAATGLVGELGQRLSRPPLNLTGRMRLGALAALVREARLLVCTDGGVSHLAGSLGVPCMVLHEANGSSPARPAEMISTDEVSTQVDRMLSQKPLPKIEFPRRRISLGTARKKGNDRQTLPS